MNKLFIAMVAGLGLLLSAEAARFEAGKGVANDRATGKNDRDVTFVARDRENGYGWRSWDTAVGLTLLAKAFPNEESNVYGARFNLGWGRYANTYGLDLGVFSSTQRSFGGIAVNLIGNAADEVKGVQLGGVNVAQGRVAGLQIGFVNVAGDLCGVQLGVLNFNGTGVACLPIVNAGF